MADMQQRQLIGDFTDEEWSAIFPLPHGYGNAWTVGKREDRVREIVLAGLALEREDRARQVREAFNTIPTDEKCNVKFEVTTCVNDVIVHNEVAKGDFILNDGTWVSILTGDPEGSHYVVSMYPARNVCGISMHQNEKHDGPVS